MKKGFTLIELLAVIVILAIIAVIALPIVLGIIDNVRIESSKRSIENYIYAAELFISQSAMNGNALSDGYYNIETLDIEVDGITPNYGYIKIKDEEIINYNLNIDNKNYIKETNGVIETLSNPLNEYSEFSIDFINQSIIKGISFFYTDSLGLNIYIDKKNIENINNVYLKVEFDDRYSSTDGDTYNITSYKNIGEYYVFSFDCIWIEEFTTNINIQIIDETVPNEPLDSIDYSVSKYVGNVVYKTKNQYEREILTSLTNLGTAAQIVFNYNAGNLANVVLNEEDKNIDTLTKEAEMLKENNYQLDENIINNTNEQFATLDIFDLSSLNLVFRDGLHYQIKIGKKVGSTSVSLSRENTTEEEFNKYGILIFTNDVFNNINDNTDNYNKLNINTPGVIDLKGEYNISPNLTAYPSFIYKHNIKKLNEPIYYRTYYKKSENEYIYSKLQIKSIISICNKNISDEKTINLRNVYISLLNFIGLL